MRTILLLLLLILVVYVARRALSQIGSPVRKPPPAKAPGSERMVACDQCGLLIPESEAIRGGEAAYCCPEHARQHSGRGS